MIQKHTLTTIISLTALLAISSNLVGGEMEGGQATVHARTVQKAGIPTGYILDALVSLPSAIVARIVASVAQKLKFSEKTANKAGYCTAAVTPVIVNFLRHKAERDKENASWIGSLAPACVVSLGAYKGVKTLSPLAKDEPGRASVNKPDPTPSTEQTSRFNKPQSIVRSQKP